MLTKLFGSNARVKVLQLLLLHPDEPVYLRQLARDLDLQINSVRRELDNLEKFGLLICKVGGEVDEEGKTKKAPTKQDRKFYSVNKNFFLYSEIKALFFKAHLLKEKDFTTRAKDLPGLRLLVLAGIFTGNTSSPVDVLAVGNISKDKFLKLVRELEKDMDSEVNYSLLTEDEYNYRREITDVFLANILDSRHSIIAVNDGLLLIEK